jgi:type VI secretion system secreted protein VgrG
MQLQELQACSLTGLTDENRPLRLRLSTERGIVDDLLLLKRVSGNEAICGGFEYRILCIAGRAGIPLKQFNAMPVELQIVTDSGTVR